MGNINGWSVGTFDDVLTIVNGKSQKAVQMDDGKYPIYGSGGIMGYSKDYLCPENSTIIGRKGTINNPIFVTTKFWNVDTAFGLCPNNRINAKLLYYYCRGYDFLKHNKSTTLPSLTKTDLLKIEIPLPPLQVQLRIVSKLDALFNRIDKAIALVEENITHAVSLQKSISDTVFVKFSEKYGTKRLEDLCNKITDGTHVTPTYVDKGIPFLSIKDMSSGVINFSDTRFITEKEHLELTKRSKPERDDILYSKVGTTGIAKKIDTDIEFSIFVSLALLKPKKELISPDYFELILNSPTVYAESQRRTRGVTNKNLVLTDIKEIVIPLPPRNEQNEAILYLRDIQQKHNLLLDEFKKRLLNLQQLKSSLLDSAFKGEL